MQPPITIDLTSLPAVTNEVYWPLFGNTSRNLLLYGGAGSGKSVFIAMKLAIRLMTESGHHIIGFRKVFRTVKTSIFMEFKKALDTLGVLELWKINLSDYTFTFRPNGNIFRCMGMDDQEKLKSIVGMTGAWLEEATEFQPADYEQVNLRLRGVTKFYKQIVISFNPISAMHWIKRRFIDADQDGRTHVVRTTFRDNRFLDAEYRRELELLKERDPQLGAIYADGQWGQLKGVIYAPFLEDAWPSSFDAAIYGLDFGFNNPMALVRVDLKDREPYLTEEIYETRLTTADLISLMNERNIDKRYPIYADAAEPDRIAEIAKAGYNVHPAAKGQGSVNAGISFCKSLRIHTKPGNVNINLENATYKWLEDKNGNALDVPFDFANHAMDAMRYAIMTHFKFHTEGTFSSGTFEGLGIF